MLLLPWPLHSLFVIKTCGLDYGICSYVDANDWKKKILNGSSKKGNCEMLADLPEEVINYAVDTFRNSRRGVVEGGTSNQFYEFCSCVNFYHNIN